MTPPHGARLWPLASLSLAALLLAGCAGAPEQTPSSDSPESSASRDVGSASPELSAAESSITGHFTVNGRDLFLNCVGDGEPTMVLEGGEGATSSSMDAVVEAYESQLRVCRYDRANNGQSGTAPTPRTGEDLVSDLQGLLRSAGVPAPYLLVGTSAGGLLVQAYAATHAEEIAGVVAINPVPPWEEWSTRAFEAMTAQERQEETHYFAGANGEGLDYRDISELIAGLPVPPNIPFHLLISTVAQCESPTDICGRTYPAAEEIMKEIVGRWDQGRLTQVDASHDIHLSNMNAVLHAIDDVLTRSESP